LPASLEELERGAVCLALYPFTFGFPLDVAARDAEDELLATFERVADIDEIEKTLAAGDVPETVTKVKLRRVLLLQGGTSANRREVMVARVTSVKDEQKTSKKGWYSRLSAGTHAAHLLIGGEQRHGTNLREAYVSLLNVAPISKTAILRRTGLLNEAEMREVSDRLITALEVDISQRLATSR